MLPFPDSNRDYVEQKFGKERKTLPERDERQSFPKVYVRKRQREHMAATVAVPDDHCFPPVLA